tara:strand:- start:116 stop:319 length:204 start_codon:yes stop_codon:yes gene_type:complete
VYEKLFALPLQVEYPKYGTLQSLKAGIALQKKLDEELSGRLRWSKWLLYTYPQWSIGTFIEKDIEIM